MSDLESIEIMRREQQLDRDVQQLLDKYLRIVEWDVPESDELHAQKLIISEIRQALDRIETTAQS
jgi:hypothetical protein